MVVENFRRRVVDMVKALLPRYTTAFRPPGYKDGIVDLSMASTDARSPTGEPLDSVAKAIESIIGAPLAVLIGRWEHWQCSSTRSRREEFRQRLTSVV